MIDQVLLVSFYWDGYVNGRLDAFRQELAAEGRAGDEIEAMLRRARAAMAPIRDEVLRKFERPVPDLAGMPAATAVVQ
jgi:hypothetical protein